MSHEIGRAFFDVGRCSGHDQFNGRYCRDVVGPEQWCIHCCGFMLQQRIEELASLSRCGRCDQPILDTPTCGDCQFELQIQAHSEGQEHTLADVNAGAIDDLIQPRIAALSALLLQESKRENL